MGEHNPVDDGENDDINRRLFMKSVAGALGVTALGSGVASAQPASAIDLGDEGLSSGDEIDPYLEDHAGDAVIIPPGTYAFGGSLNVDGTGIYGGGNPGDVVLEHTSGTFDGNVADGVLSNVVVRGQNHETKAGIDVEGGAEIDGLVHPDRLPQAEDRTFYNPDGGTGRAFIRNSAWAGSQNNGAYVDKLPMTIENCFAANNGVAQIRVGHRDGTDESETTEIRNTVVAVTVPDAGDGNPRGIRLRHPAHLVIENCWFVFSEGVSASGLVELHDGAAGSTVEIRNCHFYNDSGTPLVRDKSGGNMDVTIENCTVQGSGSRDVEPDFSGSGFSEEAHDVPTPSALTGVPQADDAWEVNVDQTPFGDVQNPGDGGGGSGSDGDDGGDGSDGSDDGSDGSDDGGDGDDGSDGGDGDQEFEHTLVIETVADPRSGVVYEFVVDGEVEQVDVESNDEVVEQNDGSFLASGTTGGGMTDEWLFTGSIQSITVETHPDESSGEHTLVLDGEDVSAEDLVGGADDGSGDGSDGDGSDGGSNDGSDGDGSGDGSGDSGGDGAPEIAQYDVTEIGSPNPHADIVADWAVSDPDGDLASVLVQVVDEAGVIVEATRRDLSGETAADVDYFRLNHVDGQSFDVRLTVRDEQGNAVSETSTVTE